MTSMKFPVNLTERRFQIEKMLGIHLLKYKHLLCALLVTALGGCASFGQDWQLQQQSGELEYFTRQSTSPSLPEFKAAITINAPLPKVMALVTDFSRHPEWVYGSGETTVIALKSYTEAYLYQVMTLPVVGDRDMILYASTTNDKPGEQIRIQIRAAPGYCDDNDDSDCAAIRDSGYIRVREAEGTFTLTRLDDGATRVEWTQFLDPGGALPHWLFRAILPQVPMRSLRRLKSLLETVDAGG